MSLSSDDMKRAIFRFCRDNRAAAVSECSLDPDSRAMGRADVLGVKFPPGNGFLEHTKYNWVCEFEVKTSLPDLVKDVDKRKWYFWRHRLPVTHFYYVVPKDMVPDALSTADLLMSTLLGKGNRGAFVARARDPKILSKAQIGVISVESETRFEVVKTAVRLQSTAPNITVNQIIGRGFWELYNMRNLDITPDRILRQQDSVNVDQVWALSYYLRRKAGSSDSYKVMVTAVDDGIVHVKNLKTGRKSKSKIEGFCRRYYRVTSTTDYLSTYKPALTTSEELG